MKAAELRRIRLRVLDLSQEAMAKRLGLHRNTLVRLETGRRKISRVMELLEKSLDGRMRRGYIHPVKPRQVVALREQLGMNQAQFAAELGVDQSTVSRWESGESTIRPSMVNLMRLLEAVRSTRVLPDRAIATARAQPAAPPAAAGRGAHAHTRLSWMRPAEDAPTTEVPDPIQVLAQLRYLVDNPKAPAPFRSRVLAQADALLETA